MVRIVIFFVLVFVAFALKTRMATARTVVATIGGHVIKDVEDGFAVEEFVFHMVNIKRDFGKCQRKVCFILHASAKKERGLGMVLEPLSS